MHTLTIRIAGSIDKEKALVDWQLAIHSLSLEPSPNVSVIHSQYDILGRDVAAAKSSLDVGNSIIRLIAAVPAGAVSYEQVVARKT